MHRERKVARIFFPHTCVTDSQEDNGTAEFTSND